MVKERLEYFKVKLLDLQEQLLISIQTLEEKSKPVSPDCSLGRLTRQEAMLEQNMALENLSQSKIKLKKIDSALDRVRHETFGECMDCGEDIVMGRLEIMPENGLCVKCASGLDGRW